MPTVTLSQSTPETRNLLLRTLGRFIHTQLKITGEKRWAHLSRPYKLPVIFIEN